MAESGPEIRTEKTVPINNLEALGQGILSAYAKTNNNPDQLPQTLGKAIADYQEKDFVKEGHDVLKVPPEIISETKNLSPEQREKVWVRWVNRVGEQAVSPSDTENTFALLHRAIQSIKQGKGPELTPLTSGSVAWLGPVKGKVTDLSLQAMLKIYDASTEDTTETRQSLKDLSTQIIADKTINAADQKTIIDAISNVLSTAGARLDANEKKGIFGGGLTPEFPKTPELLLDYVRLQLEELTELTDDPPPVGWWGQVIVTQGGFITLSLKDPRFETSPLGRTPIQITDADGPKMLTFAEYLRKEVSAAERATREAYAYAGFKSPDAFTQVSGNALGRDVWNNLGTIIDDKGLKTVSGTKIPSQYLGDRIGACFGAYKSLAEGKSIVGITYNPLTVSIKDAQGIKEMESRGKIKNLFGGGSGYAEKLAFNLALACGFSSEGNKKGTMSGTAHTAWVDRIFHLNTWRKLKEDKAGPEWTIDKPFYPQRLLLDATEMTTVEIGGKLRTIAGLLKDNGYQLRKLAWSKLPEFHPKWLVAMADASSAFKTITTYPDKAETAETGVRGVRDDFRNGLADPLFFWQEDTSGKVLDTIDGKSKTDVDARTKDALDKAVQGWITGQIREANRLKDYKVGWALHNTATDIGILPRKIL